MESRRITLVIASLAAGGAERVMSELAGGWEGHGDRVTLITLATADTDFYPVPAGVRRVGLGVVGDSDGLSTAVAANVRRAVALRRAIAASTPDLVVSFVDQTNVLTLTATVGLRVPVIACEHIDPRRHDAGRAWSALRARLYRRAAALVVLTETVRSWADRHVAAERVRVIPNPVPREALPQRTAGSGDGPATVVSMGRLAPQKGFDLLIRAFARCAQELPDWSLSIIGEGPERAQLESLARDLRIEARVRLRGRVDDPYDVLSGADLFVLSSRYEGFPMALLEAMACGLPVVSFDCDSGPRAIIRDGTDGILVPDGDVDALAVTMRALMTDAARRDALAARAVDVRERFSLDRALDAWEELFADVDSRMAR